MGFVVLVLAALAGSPQAAGREGTVTGTLTLNGVPVAISHVYASAQPGFFDKTQEDIRVLFSDVPLADADRADVFALGHLGRDGKARIVEVVVDASGDPISGAIYAKEFDGQVSVTGMHTFTRERLDRTGIAGRMFVDRPREFMRVTFQYDVHFSVPIPRPSTPAELAAALTSPPARTAAAYVAAVLRGDLPGVIAAMTREASAPFRAADGPARLADLREDMPADTKVESVEPQADGTVVVKVEGHRPADGMAVGYTLHLVPDGSGWKVGT